MLKIRKFQVNPLLPKELMDLREIAYNLYWSWDHDIRSLFRRLDRNYWDKCGQNPVLLLGNIDQKVLELRAKDDGYLAHLERAKENLHDYLSSQTWFDKNCSTLNKARVAYFSMEFGLTNCLPIYSGGLGILAADHLKSASDLGIPLVGVGLLYQEGYFQQYLSTDGWQQETNEERDFYNMPIKCERDPEGNPITISVDMAGKSVYAQIWRAQVGRISLYLLDTNIPENSPEDQYITDRLYGGDEELRIKQEILLGIGGLRALEVLGMRPDVCHMNEGHSAFLALERARIAMQENGLDFSQARQGTRVGNVFTSHTPVPAGIDEFETGLVDKYLKEYNNDLKLSTEEFHKLGGVNLPQTNGKFNMAIFAINMAGYYNGVSRLHGRVARKMWNYMWPDVPEQEVPIGHVTNGIHFRTWMSQDLSELLNRYLGPKWFQNPVDEIVWSRVDSIPDEELWRAHERSRVQLVAFTRKQLQEQLEKSGASQVQLQMAKEVLDPEALTIGFARRFAAYKRAFLIFKDLDRLKSILNKKDKPVQIILAGKSHPRDDIGKSIIRDIINIMNKTDYSHRIVFLEDYDMHIASYLVQGVDVWLNNPRKPREASGTSGMKAGANGVLNFSILDGWWDEAYERDLGWSIGRGEEYEHDSIEEQDKVESEAIYHTLENEIVPAFYNRGSSGIPRDWVQMMKNSIKKLGPVYSTNRMVRDYCTKFYLPASERWKRLATNKMQTAKDLTAWKKRIKDNWNKINFEKVALNDEAEIKVTESYKVKAWLNIDGLDPNDLSVQVYYGRIDAGGQIANGHILPMAMGKKEGNKTFLYEIAIPCDTTGQHGFALRVLPQHPELINPHELGLITWESGNTI